MEQIGLKCVRVQRYSYYNELIRSVLFKIHFENIFIIQRDRYAQIILNVTRIFRMKSTNKRMMITHTHTHITKDDENNFVEFAYSETRLNFMS